MTLREIADVLHVSPVTAWRLTSRGQLPSIRVPSGRGDRPMIRVSRDDLVDFMVAANRDQTASTDPRKAHR